VVVGPRLGGATVDGGTEVVGIVVVTVVGGVGDVVVVDVVAAVVATGSVSPVSGTVSPLHAAATTTNTMADATIRIGSRLPFSHIR
jgi:hypothetical protein